MTTIKVENFAGIAPRYSNRLLADNAAIRADNAKLLSGELRGLRETQLLFDFNDPVVLDPIITRAFRLPADVTTPIPITGADFWVGFTDPDVDFVRTPVLGDSFERYYWTGDSTLHGGKPQYNTRARIQAGDPPWVLGIPTPVNAPVVTPPAGLTFTRAYVYTFVSAYGEEGPPSDPTTADGDAGTWALSGIDTSVASPSDYNLSKVRIYRTVPGNNDLTEYFFVDEISFGTSTYNDVFDDATVALNETLPSLTWEAPPIDLQGIVAHPGGFLVGFTGRDLYMSEPYHPHAWPVQNIRTCETEIVGVSVLDNTIIVATTSRPYYADGMVPESVTLQKINSIDPCISRRSMATTIDGVYYSSPQGIVKVTSGRTDLITRELFTREEWQNLYSPTTVNAVPYGVQYIAFDTTSHGFIFSPQEKFSPLTNLDRFSFIAGIQIDAYTGDVYVLTNSQVRLWDPPTSVPYEYTWSSKEFKVPKPINFGALIVQFSGGGVSVPIEQLSDYTTFNAGRITKKLNPIGLAVLGGVRTETVAGYVGPQIKNPIGGSPLFNINGLLGASGAVQFNLWMRNLDSQWIKVYENTLTDEKIYRLPAGFKSDVWKFDLIGNAPIYSVAIAETPKELQQV